MFLGLLAIILTLVLVIGIHEAGHALAARYFFVKIQSISLGFGKPLLKWKAKSGCEWRWCLLPLGGYVQLLNSRIQPVSAEELPCCFDKQPIWIRCLILLAGAMANVFLAWLLLTLIFISGYQRNPPVIQGIIPHSLMSKAGFKTDQRILQINGQITNSWEEVGVGLISALGQADVPIMLTNQQVLHLNLCDWHYQRGQGNLFAALGIALPSPPIYEPVKGQAVLQAMWHALLKLKQLGLFFCTVIKQLLTGWLPFTLLLGPLGLFVLSFSSFLQGLISFSYFIASFSVAVALVNLLPIPGLDGSLLVYAMLEKIRGKPMSIAWELLLYRLAVIVFVIVLLQLILNDIAALITNLK